ncbi:caspase family protein [Alienimonas californiensis]|uniref:WD domain, G-beta repeat n=1 Tax=Alienimonas californiensis TaxID=2527989 RepID=A0A517P6J4_9PLAN|nr:caspase family protein [Alienimonas californiensis]QDT14998.1 WD domain, G-beta repeat [Alienimonas californiensis]
MSFARRPLPLVASGPFVAALALCLLTGATAFAQAPALPNGATPPNGAAAPDDRFSAEEANAVAGRVKNEPRHALIVGVPDYADAAIPDLPVCAPDAKAVYDLLTDPAVGGVPKANATLLIGKDASRRNILKALNDLRAVPQESTVFFYFSGHGARVGDQTYLIPQDAEAAFLAGSALSQSELDRYLKAVPASRVALFVDACFAAGLRTDPGRPTKAFAADAEAALQSFTGRGRIFFGAAGADEEALTAPDKQRSVFTLHLLEGLGGKADGNGDGVVTAFEVAAYLDGTVSAEARKRGGLHRPRVDIPADVVDPSRYPLTIHAAALKSRTAAAVLLRQRLDVLDGFFLDGALTRPQRDQAATLLSTDEPRLSRLQRQARDTALAAVERGAVDERLTRALDLMVEQAPPPSTGAPSTGEPKGPTPMRLRAVVPPPRVAEGHLAGVLSLAVAPDGQRAVSGSWDKTLRVWNLAEGTAERTLEGHRERVNAVAITPDGTRALSGSWDRTLAVWNLADGQPERALNGHSWGVLAATITPDGQRALSGSWDKTVRVWTLADGREQFVLKGHAEQINSIAVAPDGGRAVSASDDGTLRVWNLADGREERVLEGHAAAVRAVAIAPDGERAVSGDKHGALRIWNLTTGAAERTMKGHPDGVNAVAITPDGRRAVSGGGDGTVRVWNLAAGAAEGTLEGHTGSVNAVAITPDGRQIVSGSNDRTLRLWDAFERE